MLSPALPLEFVHAILNDSPFGSSLLTALEMPSPTSIRINPRKSTPSEFVLGDSVPWNKQGYYLEHRPSFTLDPLYHAGVYYAQEAASMVLGSIVNELPLGENPILLDACAAPGGKTIAMADGLPSGAVIVANEINRHRSNILAENLSKWGLDNVLVTQQDTEAFLSLSSLFDVVLIDAPCSGEGMFRKDLKARKEWNPNSPELCSNRQIQIIDNLKDCVKPGGYIIYSTCTFNRKENEDQVKRLLDSKSFELYPWNVPDGCVPGRNGIGHYFIPGLTESEGLYIAVLKKLGYWIPFVKEEVFTSDAFNLFPVNPTSEQVIYQGLQGYHLVSKSLYCFLKHLKKPFLTKKIGAKIYDKSDRSIVPDHDLSLLTSKPTNLPTINLSKAEALRYLRGETFPIENNTPGIYLITYEQTGLGFIKHLGNRFNNLYPKEWRIRMQLG